LAPEHPFPAAVDDAQAALSWVLAHGGEIGVDTTRVAVGGDSAGGTLAAVTALWARDQGIDLRLQLLVYPAVDLAGDDYPSRSANTEDYMIDEGWLQWLIDTYVSGAPVADWRVSPLRAPRHAGLAPALVITAEYDPLRDEGEAYAAKLEAAGVPAKASRYDGMIHGFFSLGPIIPAARPAVDEAGAALHAALHG
jgi:acetyl esterase